MKKIFLTFLILTSAATIYAQNVFQSGEYFKFKISYGLFSAGYATLELNETTYDGKKVFHAKGFGQTTGVTKAFFKVRDDYQSYFDVQTGRPYRSIRDIYEGGYTRNQESLFNYSNNTVKVIDHKNSKTSSYSISNNIQDVISAFYALRNNPKISNMKKNESIQIDMFFDDEIYKFKLKFLGKEKIKTKFGEQTALKFRPYVQAGRVFKEQESLTIWVSDDSSKVPLRVEASLLVGSLKAELVEHKGLKQKLGN